MTMEPPGYVASEPFVPPIDPAVVAATRAELLVLRSGHGQLTMSKLSGCPHLVQLCGEGDLVEAFMMLGRELARYEKGNKYEAAAALSLSSPADTVLDRFTMTAEHFDYQDQRTIRRWSDRGLGRIAEDLAAIANVRGRLGRELLTLTLQDAPDGRHQLMIDQMDFAQLDGEPPSVTIWIWHDEDNADQAAPELTSTNSRHAEDGSYRNTRWRIALPPLGELLADLERRHRTNKLITIAVQGRSAPARTAIWRNEATLPEGLLVEVVVHRTMVMVELEVENTGLDGEVPCQGGVNVKPSSAT